jgi:arabinogalactan oligomer/maltooligosaccharide transport system permease protein
MTTSPPSAPPSRRLVGEHPLHIVAPNLRVLVVKVIGLGLVLAVAIALTPTMAGLEMWVGLAALWVVTLVIIAVYLTGRAIPAKYLLPGTLLLVLLTIYPILLTIQTSTTNYGDGTRSTKEEAVARIVGTSAVPVPDGRTFSTVVGTEGSVTTGPFSLLLVDQATGEPYVGDPEDGLVPLDGATVTDGTITEGPGYTLLTRQEQNDISGPGQPLDGFTVPVDGEIVIRLQGFNALEMRTPLVYDEEADTITNIDTGVVYSPERAATGDRSFFTDPEGNRLSNQSWGENVGLLNYERLFTDPRITGPFISIFIWTVVFATVVVASSYLVGLVIAVALNEPRLRFQRFFRSIIILPYAVPGFILLLVWSGFWNRDYGLINSLFGTSVDWLTGTGTARAAVLITQLWLGFPYMFLICTGALQSVPSDLREAASIDGATGLTQFWRISFPLVLVSTAPLLVASFAFNFNNFNAIQLLTGGGPFRPDNPTAGGTDILVSYTYRLAFGGVGEQIGFASAVSVILFILTAVIAAVQFRGTRKLEEVY